MKYTINTREDLDAIVGTPAHEEFMALLAGSMIRREDQADYPEGYNEPDYSGDIIEPVWVEVEDLSTIERFGFTKSDLV